jgi:hypothetical protein
LISFSLSLAFTLPGLVMMGGGIGITFTLLRSQIANITPPQYRGGIVGIGEAALRLASAATPLLMGFVISSLQPDLGLLPSLELTLVGFGITAGISGTAFLCVAPSHPRQTTTTG